jgi:hypothetical protein
VQTERGEHVDASVHARDDGEATSGTSVGDVGASGGVRGVVGEKAIDLGHRHLARWRGTGGATAKKPDRGRRPRALRQYERGADGTWHDCLLMDLLAEDLGD